MDREEFVRLYGPWAPRTPLDAKELFAGYGGTWWISGGWALEAFTGVRRAHEDIDPSVLRRELPVLRAHLAGRLHVWAAVSGSLHPLTADFRPDATAEEVLPDGCGQLWTRRSANDPWEYDILLEPGTPTEWVYKRDPAVRMPLADALWTRGGIPYLRPEIQLLYKAKGLRPKDQADFDAALPRLGDERRSWLGDALERTHAGHPWIDALRPDSADRPHGSR